MDNEKILYSFVKYRACRYVRASYHHVLTIHLFKPPNRSVCLWLWLHNIRSLRRPLMTQVQWIVAMLWILSAQAHLEYFGATYLYIVWTRQVCKR
jgi:hypothetical protein